MELSKLRDKLLDIFDIDDIEKLPNALMRCVSNNNTAQMSDFCTALDDDLKSDQLQMVYQYYHADRQDKKQDYTPRCLAQFLSRLIGDSTETVDMCAGSGALTIQRWQECPDTQFTLYEIDGNVIPFLLFNLAVRNITATVYQGDVLQGENTRGWKIERGERFGRVISI